MCSNSLRGASIENAVGLLKEELARLDSIVVTCARETAVPAGGALAVDRERFSTAVETQLARHPRIALHREEVREIPRHRPAIVACGPLPSDDLVVESMRCCALPSGAARTRLHYYDAASPIVAADSIDETPMFRKSRYDKGDGDDYLNIPLDRDAVSRTHRRFARVDAAPSQRFRDRRGRHALLRRLSADRGDGRPRRGDVALRSAQTGRSARSSHRENAVCGRATSQRERRKERRSIWSAFKRG